MFIRLKRWWRAVRRPQLVSSTDAVRVHLITGKPLELQDDAVPEHFADVERHDIRQLRHMSEARDIAAIPLNVTLAIKAILAQRHTNHLEVPVQAVAAVGSSEQVVYARVDDHRDMIVIGTYLPEPEVRALLPTTRAERAAIEEEMGARDFAAVIQWIKK